MRQTIGVSDPRAGKTIALPGILSARMRWRTGRRSGERRECRPRCLHAVFLTKSHNGETVFRILEAGWKKVGIEGPDLLFAGPPLCYDMSEREAEAHRNQLGAGIKSRGGCDGKREERIDDDAGGSARVGK